MCGVAPDVSIFQQPQGVELNRKHLEEGLTHGWMMASSWEARYRVVLVTSPLPASHQAFKNAADVRLKSEG